MRRVEKETSDNKNGVSPASFCVSGDTIMNRIICCIGFLPADKRGDQCVCGVCECVRLRECDFACGGCCCDGLRMSGHV